MNKKWLFILIIYAFFQAQAKSFTYKVKKGDTLFKISKKFNIRMEAIKENNSFLKKRPLLAGDSLQLPGKNNIPTTNLRQYTVQKGDTLYKISKKFNIKIAAIKNRNPFLKKRVLRARDTLNLHKQSSSTRLYTYTIQKGDTISAISVRYNLRIRAIKKHNPGLNISKLQVGTQLKLPINPAQTPQKTRAAPKARPRYYKVRKGDTLLAIGLRHDLSVEQIKSQNPFLKKRCLQAGDRLALKTKYKSQRRSNRKKINRRHITRQQKQRKKRSAKIKFHLQWPLQGKYRLQKGKSLYINGQKGQIVRAAKTGKVVYISDYGVMGILITLEHQKNIKTYYLHLDKSFVQKGQTVKQGEAIGTLGSRVDTIVRSRRKISHLKRTQLRFEVTYGDNCLNPLKFL